jgi:hypothetical protein
MKPNKKSNEKKKKFDLEPLKIPEEKSKSFLM